jgi:hypothetical protein
MRDLAGSEEAAHRPGTDRCAVHFMTALSRFRETTLQENTHDLNGHPPEK